MKPLLPLVEGNPDEAEKQRQYRYVVGKQAQDQATGGRGFEGVGVDQLEAHHHFAGGGAFVFPEQDDDGAADGVD